MSELLVRRLAGTAAAILAVAGIIILFRTQYAPPADTYTVDVVFGRAGSGLTTMSDVKARGVRIGSVDSLEFADGEARGVIRIMDDVQLPAPEDITLTVTAKTLLGEKQVTIDFPDERFGEGPFLADGDMVVADTTPTELNEVLDTLEPFIDAIDGEQLATIVDALAEGEGEAEVVRENLELATELSEFGARTAPQGLDNLEDVTRLAQALRPTLDEDLDRIRASLPEATRILREDGASIDQALRSVSGFSVELAELLEVQEEPLDRLLETGDPVFAMLEDNRSDIGGLIQGTADYMRLLGGTAGSLDDDTVFAYFRLFVTDSTLGPLAEIGAGIPDLPTEGIGDGLEDLLDDETPPGGGDVPGGDLPGLGDLGGGLLNPGVAR